MFKYIHLFLCFIYLSYGLPSFTQEELEDRQIEILASTLESFQKEEHKNIWNDFTLNDIPSVVHFKNGHIYSFNLPESPDWEKVSIGQRVISFSKNDKWGITKQMMHPSFKIDAIETFVFSLESKNQLTTLNLPMITFVHERFHLYQFEHFNRDDEKGGGYVNEWDEDNQILIGLENWLLTEYLKEQSAEKKIEWIKDFMAVNVKRMLLLAPSSVKWEDIQQRMEGLADYVGVKTFEVFPLMDFPTIDQALLVMREKKNGPEVNLINDAIKSRHYFVGAVLASALDLLEADWKNPVEKGLPLRKALFKKLALTDKEIEKRFNLLLASTEHKQIASTIKENLTNEKNELGFLLQKFEESEGLALYLGRPLQPISGGGKNKKSCHLGRGHSLVLEDTSFSSSQDQQWRLNFKKIPYIIENPRGERAFKIDQNTIFKINSQEISVKDLQEGDTPFSSLSWKDAYCEFATELSGSIYVDQDEIYIDFD